MVSFWKWFGDKAKQVKTFYSTTYKFKKLDKIPADSPEIMRVVNKFASIFMDADIQIQSANDVIQKTKTEELNKLLSTEPLYRGKNAFLSKFCKIAILQGGAVLQKTVVSGKIAAIDLIKPDSIQYTTDNTQSRLNISNFRELFSALKYNDFYTGRNVQLNIDDISFFVDNVSPFGHLFLLSRLAEIQGKINNSFYANNMLSSMLNRCALVFLTKENKTEFTTIDTSTEVQNRNKDFTEAYNVGNSAVVPMGENMRVLNTSINVKATGVFDSFEDTIASACNLLGITSSVMEITGTTYSNQQGAIKDAIQNGVQSFANKVADFLEEMLLEYNMITANEKVVFDYTEVLQRNLATTPDQVQEQGTEEQGTEQPTNGTTENNDE